MDKTALPFQRNACVEYTVCSESPVHEQYNPIIPCGAVYRSGIESPDQPGHNPDGVFFIIILLVLHTKKQTGKWKPKHEVISWNIWQVVWECFLECVWTIITLLRWCCWVAKICQISSWCLICTDVSERSRRLVSLGLELRSVFLLTVPSLVSISWWSTEPIVEFRTQHIWCGQMFSAVSKQVLTKRMLESDCLQFCVLWLVGGWRLVCGLHTVLLFEIIQALHLIREA